MAEPLPSLVTYAAYLAGEQASDIKHEYLRGEVYAMAGGTPEHSALATAIAAELVFALRGRPCRVYGSDLRIRIDATDLSTYPDVSVVCGTFEASSCDPHAAINPVLIVEVLSDSTEGYDRGEKFAHYRALPSLREYVLVSQRTRRIESYRKSDEGVWSLSEAREGEVLYLWALHGVGIEVDAVYRDPLV